jgi:hypothetical protein
MDKIIEMVLFLAWVLFFKLDKAPVSQYLFLVQCLIEIDIHIEKANSQCQGIACTKSFCIHLTSALKTSMGCPIDKVKSSF